MQIKWIEKCLSRICAWGGNQSKDKTATYSLPKSRRPFKYDSRDRAWGLKSQSLPNLLSTWRG